MNGHSSTTCAFKKNPDCDAPAKHFFLLRDTVLGAACVNRWCKYKHARDPRRHNEKRREEDIIF